MGKQVPFRDLKVKRPGTPITGTISSNNRTMRIAFWSGAGKTNGHLVKKSWNTIRYRFPCSVTGSSMMSTSKI